MKKLAILLAAGILLLAGCADGAMKRLEDAGFDFGFTWENNTGSSSINVYNWGEFMDEDLNKAFETVTGIKVNFDTYSTNEVLYSKLMGGGSNYDVIVPSDYMIGRLIEEGMLAKLDFNNIPNSANIDPKLKNPGYDPENLYSVPYMWGTVGLIYDKTRVSSPPDSWSALFDPLYSGQILMFNNSRDAFGIALKTLGYSVNTTDETRLEEAFELLASQYPLVQAYVMDEIFDKMEGGEAILAPYYAGDAITMMGNNQNLAFVIPSEGSNIFTDAFCIPVNARNKAAAEMYINFMCLYQAGKANMIATEYSTPLLDVFASLDESVKNNGISYPQDLSMFEYFQNLPEDTRRQYDRLWTRLFI
jgi:spermidine/putrescine transport system substrate-binding protein